MSAGTYTFRLATHADLPMLRRWLQVPEVVQWWGDPEEQEALITEDLDNPLMIGRIVSYAGRPFAYAQDYAVHSWPQPHFEGLPPGTRSIDSFIGERDMLGLGHGSGFLRALAQSLIDEGAPMVAIDPDVENHRARRAYAKAGFVGEEVVETGEGPAVLMLYKI
jgi:aminoglycoside 6'-N-acetyltransferase